MRSTSLLTPWPLLAMLMVAGCSGQSAGEADAGNMAGNDAAANLAQPPTQSAPANAVAIREKAGEIQFDYSWPQAAADIPALDSWLRGNGEQLRKQTMDGGRRDEAEAKKAGYPFRGNTYQEDWSIEADVPSLLVMQSLGYAFTGGAHGMPIVTTLLWDKASGKRLPTSALLDMAVLDRGLKDRFCTALDAERAKRRGEPVKSGDPNQLAEFVQCVDLAKQTVLPVSLKGQALDTIRVVIMPYEAGPYSEGIYQLDLPVDAAVLQAVRPAYKDAFVAA
ncbi:MAG TPA: DUF4163 domain-containing protein [Sphingobium sp.]|nr:DUF4163 domain-containing protein [Sphingobium sp.]